MKTSHLILAMAMAASVPAWPADQGHKGATFGRKVENTFRNWKVEELPAAVQKTVREQSFGHKIKDIDREDRTGQTIWEVRFSGGPHGEARKVHIDNDGRVLDHSGRPVAAGSAASAEKRLSASTPPPPAPGNEKGPEPKTQRKWADVPRAVKRASAKYGGEKYIRDIDVETRDGMTVWELEFSREGQNIELHFAEDGRILEHIDSGKQSAPNPAAK